MQPTVAIVGATATGKSELAVALARRLGGAVVNADAMQLYRGMDVGTAKLPPSERHGVDHLLLDVLAVDEDASVAVYQGQARSAVDRIARDGRLPLLVGGSGLYVRAVVDDLDIPPTDPVLRGRLEAELAELGAPALHARLRALDATSAAGILPSNGRRVVRALEVLALTGRPFRPTLPTPSYRRPTIQLGLSAPREVLDARVEARVDRMLAAGLVEEVIALAGRGLRDGRTAGRALGYAQVLRHLDGELTLDQVREQTVAATRRFARRQESWFRRDPRVHWLAHDRPDLVAVATGLVESSLVGPVRVADPAPRLSR